MTGPRFARAENVAWRVGPDRVLVRRVGAGDSGAADLLGASAMVWIALDEPRATDELVAELRAFGMSTDDVDSAVRALTAEGFVRTAP
jgi:hypothetical protein